MKYSNKLRKFGEKYLHSDESSSNLGTFLESSPRLIAGLGTINAHHIPRAAAAAAANV